MKWDPYTLVVILNEDGKAEGELYVDDGESFDYKSGAHIHRRFDFSEGALTSSALPNVQVGSKVSKEYLKKMKDVRIERVVVVNAPKSWLGRDEVVITELGKDRTAVATFFAGKDGAADWAVVKRPHVGVGNDWVLRF